MWIFPLYRKIGMINYCYIHLILAATALTVFTLSQHDNVIPFVALFTNRVMHRAKIEDRQSLSTNNVVRQQLQPYGILSVILL